MMKSLVKIIFIGFLLFPLFAVAQQKDSKQTDQQLIFSEVWVWEYANINGKKGEMAIYREPKLNYWLLTPDDASFRETDEMTLWFILKPNGEVLQAYLEGENNPKGKLMKHQLQFDKKIKLPNYWKATGKIKKFGDANSGFPKFTGKEYRVRYGKTNDYSIFYLTTTNANFAALAYFNDLNIDAKLPIRFPKDVPDSFITLSERMIFLSRVVQYNFRYMSQTAYEIDLGELK